MMDGKGIFWIGERKDGIRKKGWDDYAVYIVDLLTGLDGGIGCVCWGWDGFWIGQSLFIGVNSLLLDLVYAVYWIEYSLLMKLMGLNIRSTYPRHFRVIFQFELYSTNAISLDDLTFPQQSRTQSRKNISNSNSMLYLELIPEQFLEIESRQRRVKLTLMSLIRDTKNQGDVMISDDNSDRNINWQEPQRYNANL